MAPAAPSSRQKSDWPRQNPADERKINGPKGLTSIINRPQNSVKSRMAASFQPRTAIQRNVGSLVDFEWLVSADASAWLEMAAQEAEPGVGLVARLRRDLSAERTHLVLEQAALRRRAKEKFAAATKMFFTPQGLEQATDELIADYKARRFAERISTSNEQLDLNGVFIADFCCGIGGDLLALSRRFPAVGVDRDPIAALLADANLAVDQNCERDCTLTPEPSPLAGRGESLFHAPRLAAASRVAVADVSTFPFAEIGAWHIDPDRRPAGRRTTRPTLHDPPPEAIERLLAVCPNAAVKLAPAATLPDGWPARAELEWITSRRECRQLVAWFGELATQPGIRRATVLSAAAQPAESKQCSFTGNADLPTPIAERIGRNVFEPDPAILAAGLIGALAAKYGFEAVAPRVPYLTGDLAAGSEQNALQDGTLACFEVLDVLPLRIKAIREWLRARGIGQVEVKKRGVDIDPAKLAAELRSSADEQATLLVCPRRGRTIAIIARRC